MREPSLTFRCPPWLIRYPFWRKERAVALEIGVHYWPLRKGLALWRDFDFGEVREDFARIAEWGLSPVQVSLLWEDFQPEPQRVNLRALDRLVKIAQMAMDFGLEILVAPFTGYLMGTLFLPPWMAAPSVGSATFPIRVGGLYLEAGVRAPWEDPEVRSARIQLLREVHCALRGHPTLRGWNLGHPTMDTVSTSAREETLGTMRELVEELCQEEEPRLIAFQIHMGDLEEDRGTGPAQIAEAGAVPMVEAFFPRPAWSRSADDPFVPLFLAFLIRWLSRREEFAVMGLGFPKEVTTGEVNTDSDSAVRYAQETLEPLRRYTNSTVLWWPYGDDPSANGPMAGFGLVDRIGRETPVLEVLRKLRGGSAAEAFSLDWIDLEQEDYWKEPRGQIQRLYGRFRERLS